MVVDEADALHERVDDRRADEPEAAPAEVGRQRVRRGASWPGSGRVGADARQPRRRWRDDPGQIGGERAGRPRRSPGTRPRCRSSRRSSRRLRTIPASAIRRARSASSKAATTAGSKPRKAARNDSRLRRIVDHDSPAWNDSSASRSKSSTSSWTGGAPLLVVVGDHQRVRARDRPHQPMDSGRGRRSWPPRYAGRDARLPCPDAASMLPRSRRERHVGQHGAVRRRPSRPRRRRHARSTSRSAGRGRGARPSTSSSPRRRTSRSAATRTAGGSPASPPPSRRPPYAALVLFSYPLHPPGAPERTEARIAHWPAIRCPVLLLSGESDPFARIDLLRAAVALTRRGGAGDLSAPRPHPEAGPRRRARPGGGVPAAGRGWLTGHRKIVELWITPLSRVRRPRILTVPPRHRATPGRSAYDTASMSPPVAPRRSPDRAGPAVDPADARRAHRAVPVGRSSIASAVRPPQGGLRRPPRDDHARRRHRTCDDPGAATRRVWRGSCTRSAASNPAAATRPGTHVGRVRQVPDHAGELARPGRAAISATPAPSRRRPTRRSSPAAKFTALYRAGTLAPRRLLVADRSSSGPPAGRPSPRKYVTRVMRYTSGATRRPTAAAGARLQQVLREERQRSPTPGRGDSAATRGYAGDARPVRDRSGATATFTFTGTRSSGTARSDRRAARPGSSVDGVAVKTVDLQAGSFTAHKAIFSKSWATAAKHTLIIEVVGTAGRPYVAIDELAVAK